MARLQPKSKVQSQWVPKTSEAKEAVLGPRLMARAAPAPPPPHAKTDLDAGRVDPRRTSARRQAS
ncbi:hypothetical protein PG994_000972 [Apiospora phragmitis]|uniref:Uncharacterized protein n=1 Tax=Apiospora phragmitis TaxID=2905665 RepID=A0ABR1WSD8_9PEZI